MTTILVPYHQDERLPDGDIPVRAEITVTPDLPAGDIWSRLTALYEAVASTVAAAGPGPVVLAPVVFSGDCLVAGATVAGVQRTGVDPAVVWFDGHGDVHTLETTTSGYLGGLSLRLLTGAHPGRYARPIGLRPVPAGRAVLVDARDLDPAEAEYLAGSAMRRIPVPEVSAATVPAGPLVVHADLDVIDPGELPGLRVPAPGGPSAGEVVAALRRLQATGRVVAWDIACTWLPATSGAQTRVRRQLLASLPMVPAP
jgi:arginase